jgi:hypothetical protein
MPPSTTTGLNASSFTFQVQDNGGTANGGIDLDTTPNTTTIHLVDFRINSGATATSTTTAQINNILCTPGSQIAISTTDPYTANWQSCVSSTGIVLPSGDGTKTVWMRWKDTLGNETDE